MSNPLIFLSYSHQDEQKAVALAQFIEKHKFDVWLDIRKLEPGSAWEQEIKEAIRKATFFIIIISHNSMSDDSYVSTELKYALGEAQSSITNDKYIIPIKIDDVTVKNEHLARYQFVELKEISDDQVGQFCLYLLKISPTINRHKALFLHFIGSLCGFVVWYFLPFTYKEVDRALITLKDDNSILPFLHKASDVILHNAANQWIKLEHIDEIGGWFWILMVPTMLTTLRLPGRFVEHKNYAPLGYTLRVFCLTIVVLYIIYFFIHAFR